MNKYEIGNMLKLGNRNQITYNLRGPSVSETTKDKKHQREYEEKEKHSAGIQITAMFQKIQNDQMT